MIINHILSLIYNLGESANNSGNSGILPGIVGGVFGGYHNIMESGVRGKILENQQSNGSGGSSNQSQKDEDFVKERMKKLF